MAQVLVRQLDDDVVAALRERAERNSRSLEGELRAILIEAARPSARDRVALAREVRALSVGTAVGDLTELVREDRER